MDKIFLVAFGIFGFTLIFFSRGILIFLAILCLSLTAVPYGGIGRAALNLRWAFFVLFCLHVFSDIFLGRTVRRIKPFDVLALFFILFAFISMSYSAFPQLTLERSATVLALYISVFWVIWKYAYDRGKENVVRIILQAAGILFFTGYLMIFIGPYRPFFAGRFSGIYGNPNGLGVMSAIILPLSIWLFLDTRKKSSLFLFLMVVLNLFLCASRGSLNAAVISTGYLLYIRSRKYRPLLFFFSISVILILFWAVETLIKQSFQAYIRVESLPVLGGRLEVWPIAMDFITQKPFFGYGFGVEDKIIELKRVVLHRHSGAYIHNSYLGITLQLGALGLVVFFLPLFSLLYKEIFSKTKEPAPLLRYALRASLIAGLLCCIYESWIYSVGNAMVLPFWIMIMLLVFYRHQDTAQAGT